MSWHDCLANLDLPGCPSVPKFDDVPIGWVPGQMVQPDELRGSHRRAAGRIVCASGARDCETDMPGKDRGLDIRRGHNQAQTEPAVPVIRRDVVQGREDDCGGSAVPSPELRERSSSFAGTVFEGSKKDLTTWTDRIRPLCWNVPIEGIAEICGPNHNKAPSRNNSTLLQLMRLGISARFPRRGPRVQRHADVGQVPRGKKRLRLHPFRVASRARRIPPQVAARGFPFRDHHAPHGFRRVLLGERHWPLPDG